MLDVHNLSAGYGDIIAVRDLSFSVKAGETLALMGANGAGKSSTLMSLIGLVAQKTGQITMQGEDISALPVEARISKGLAIVPEGRRIFPDLSVRENLIIGGHIAKTADMEQMIDTVYGYFPRLKERHTQYAGSLSGGEQQMLAIGRGLISQPELLIIDELSLGLMPKIVDECYQVLDQLNKDGLAIILVEQNSERALNFSHKTCILEAGNLIWSGLSHDAKNTPDLIENLMGMH